MSFSQDLKKYQFYYWFGFPALCPENNIVLKEPAKPLTDVLTQIQVTPLTGSFISIDIMLVIIVFPLVHLLHIEWDSQFQLQTGQK
jgi:hypothetical protein